MMLLNRALTCDNDLADIQQLIAIKSKELDRLLETRHELTRKCEQIVGL